MMSNPLTSGAVFIKTLAISMLSGTSVLSKLSVISLMIEPFLKRE